jgi:G6PDH family F420-dependent oxidoreductase
VENARLYDVPDEPIPIVVSAFGAKAAELAASEGDGIWMTAPNEESLRAYQRAGGTGPRIGQLTLCWAPTEAEAVDMARRVWPNSALPGQLAQELPTPTLFEQAVELVDDDDIRASFACGPDPEPILEQLRSYEQAGLDHVHLHQIGPDQAGFLQFWERELRPKL